ncbi:MAG: electron transfer flavoprotein subunit alpha/FixB family protein [Leptospirales bacterium]|nr:electron transfer flavoprotein subunit alpha/FixB family protein [Leptospirales bacterium]
MRNENIIEENIFVVLDTIEDKLIEQSLELITFSKKLIPEKSYKIIVLVPGRDMEHICKKISNMYGVETVALEHNDLYYPNPELTAESICLLTEKYNPKFIIFTHTMRNVQAAAKLSVKLNAESVTSIESFIYDDSSYIFQRSIFNAKIKMNVKINSPVNILTILSGVSSIPEERVSPKYGLVINEKISVSIDNYKPQSLSKSVETDIKLEEADVIIAAGRGIGEDKNLELIKETASLFKNSAIGASRPVCDNRWLPFSHQVGLTGRIVSPKFYMACGISGSQQHIAGMKNSQIIAAINKDPNAAIFSIADYIIVDDLLSFLPVFIEKVRD